MTEDEQTAYDLGVDHARAAASWCIDGNTSQEHIRRMVDWLDAGDPRAYDLLPRQPDLSGEYADDLTPVDQYELVTGNSHGIEEENAGLAYETLVGSAIDALADAYERGVDDTFHFECERILRAALED